MITFKIGIIGAGSISGRVAETLSQLEGFDICAVAARDKDRAESFAERYGIPRAYGSYEELLSDEEVELCYVGTINTTHAEIAKKCIEAGKPVLVEKPFALNLQSAREIMQLARDKKVFAGEALWYKFTPVVSGLMESIKQGSIGYPRYIEARIGYDLRERERVTDPQLGGGALLDIGIYPISFINYVFGGNAVNAAPVAARNDKGVDVQGTVSMSYPNGRLGTAMYSALYDMDNRMTIYGTEGRIEIDNCNCPEKIQVFGHDGEVKELITTPDNWISGYEYQFLDARKAVITGKIESEVHPHNAVLGFLAFSDMLRTSWNVTLPFYGEPTPEILKVRAEEARRLREAAAEAKKEK